MDYKGARYEDIPAITRFFDLNQGERCTPILHDFEQILTGYGAIFNQILVRSE